MLNSIKFVNYMGVVWPVWMLGHLSLGMPILFNYGSWRLCPQSVSLKCVLLPDLHIHTPKKLQAFFLIRNISLYTAIRFLQGFCGCQPVACSPHLVLEKDGKNNGIPPPHTHIRLSCFFPYYFWLSYSSSSLIAMHNYQGHLDA